MYYSPTDEVQALFADQCDKLSEEGKFQEEMYHAVGVAIIRSEEYFTVAVQPIAIDGELVYAITQYGSDGVIIVDEESHSSLEIPNWCSSGLLPLGFKKVMALSEILHAENVKKFGIKKKKKKYRPKTSPYIAYLKSIGKASIGAYFKIYYHKFVNSTFYAAIMVMIFAMIVGAILGGFLAIYIGQRDSVPAYMCAGAITGIAYFLISLIPGAKDLP